MVGTIKHNHMDVPLSPLIIPISYDRLIVKVMIMLLISSLPAFSTMCEKLKNRSLEESFSSFTSAFLEPANANYLGSNTMKKENLLKSSLIILQ